MAFIKKQKRKLNNVEKWTVGVVTAGKPVSTDELRVGVLRYAIETPLELLHIADSTTASKGDVYNVLMSLPKVMALFMKWCACRAGGGNGRSVKLEDIGTLLAAGFLEK